MFKLLPLLVLSVLAVSLAQEDSDLEDVIRQLQERATRTTTPTTITTKPKDEVETCVTESDEPGECVLYYLCNNGSVSTDGYGLLDSRTSVCTSTLEICCRTPDLVGPVQPVKPNEGCGWRNKDEVRSRVLGAPGITDFGEFPWMVAIFKVTVDESGRGGSGGYSGGGSLIHPRIVLTAAHIVQNASAAQLRVRAGEWDLQATSEPHPHQDRSVATVVIHSDFTRRTLFNDVALLFLEEPVSEAPHVGVACLPPAAGPPPAGACLASGWGKDKFGNEGSYQTILRSVEVPVVDRLRCTQLLRRTPLGRYFMLHHSFMCAGERDRDTCTGDGGSPLVCPSQDEGRYVQHGVVSWGIGCAGASPGVYAAVAAVRPWIDEQVTKRGFDPSVYTLG